MTKNKRLLALDVGEARIGVDAADTGVRIGVPLQTIEVDGTEIDKLQRIIKLENPDVLVVGYPRNQSGEPTKQTAKVEEFARKLEPLHPNIVYQDESLTSVNAEEHLKNAKKNYSRGDIDMLAAALILQDYLEINYA